MCKSSFRIACQTVVRFYRVYLQDMSVWIFGAFSMSECNLNLKCGSLTVLFLTCLFQMWMSVLKRATAARAVPTRKGRSSVGAFRATSSDLTSAAAKLWVKPPVLYFNLDMWPQSRQGLTSNKSIVFIFASAETVSVLCPGVLGSEFG